MQQLMKEPRRRELIGVHSLDHFCIAVPDLAKAQTFYDAFGLKATPQGQTLALSASAQKHHWGRLVEGPRTKRGTEEMTNTSLGVQELRTRIGEMAKAKPTHRFWGLYTHVWKLDILREAYQLAKQNNGAPGVDGWRRGYDAGAVRPTRSR